MIRMKIMMMMAVVIMVTIKVVVVVMMMMMTMMRPPAFIETSTLRPKKALICPQNIFVIILRRSHLDLCCY